MEMDINYNMPAGDPKKGVVWLLLAKLLLLDPIVRLSGVIGEDRLRWGTSFGVDVQHNQQRMKQ
jgi:hypothetical protein